MTAIRDFLLLHRQTGSTTALALTAIQCGGTLVVNNAQQAHKLFEQFPIAKSYTFVTVYELDKLRGSILTGPVFFDNCVIESLVQ